MAVAKRQGREKPTKLEQRKVRGPEWGPQIKQIALLASPIYIRQAQGGGGKKHKKRSQNWAGVFSLPCLLATAFLDSFSYSTYLISASNEGRPVGILVGFRFSPWWFHLSLLSFLGCISIQLDIFFLCGFSISLVATENDILVKNYFSYTYFFFLLYWDSGFCLLFSICWSYS